MRKLFTNKFLIILVILLVAGYLAYDRYFTLPFNKPPAGSETDEPQQQDEIAQFNILILGLDGREGIDGNRTDTIMVATIDGETNQARLLSIPRDTRVKIKGHWDRINAAYAYGGIDLALQTISGFLKIPIDRYVVVDFESVVNLVDAVGGIEVDVPVRMYVPLEGIDLKPGLQHLTGKQALGYMRYRYTAEGDIDRAKRQQEVMQILVKKILLPENLPKIGQFIEIAQENVQTDISTKEMIALARIAPDIMDNGLQTEVLPGRNQKIDGLWYWIPDTTGEGNVAEKAKPTQVATEDIDGT